MPNRFRIRRPAAREPERYGEQRRSRGDHRAVRVGHVFRPEYSRKMMRMITRLFR